MRQHKQTTNSNKQSKASYRYGKRCQHTTKLHHRRTTVSRGVGNHTSSSAGSRKDCQRGSAAHILACRSIRFRQTPKRRMGIGSRHTIERIPPHSRPDAQRLWPQKHLQHGALLRLIFIAGFPGTAAAYRSNRNSTVHISRPESASTNCAEPFCSISNSH